MLMKHRLLAAAIASACFGTCVVANAATAPMPAATQSPDAQQGTSSDQSVKAGVEPGATQAAVAKESDKAKKSNKKEDLAKTLSAITVTGFSKSIATSIDLQRYADTVQNVVTAADIGGLPDQSIADALTRLPGVSAERIGGQASQINIRGLSGNFVQTTLNGREQASASGSNFIQFDQYPSELINQATVYKSSQASLIEGGVGGTVAMQTANPLDNKQEQTFNLDARGSYNDYASHVYGASSEGYRLSAAWQGKFLNDTLGVGLGFARMQQPHVSEQFVGEAFNGSPEPVNNGAQQAYVPEGLQLQQNGGTEKRDGYLATVVWKPTDDLKITGDSFFSKYHNGSFGRGLRAQNFYQGQAQIINPIILPNGALVGGTVSSPADMTHSQFGVETTADNYTTNTNTFSGGLNLQWNHGPWTIDADASLARAASHNINVDTTADPYTGLGTASPALMSQSLSYALNGLKVGKFSVPDPSVYTNLNDMALSRYGIYPYVFHDKVKAFRTNVSYEMVDNPVFSAIEGGVALNNHTYAADRSMYVYGSEWNSYPQAGELPLALNSSNAVNRCWSGSFASFPCFLAINGAQVLASHGITGTPQKDWNNNWTFIQSGSVSVKTRSLWLMGDIDTNVFDHSVTGNVGVRVVRTQQYSYGLQQVGNGAGVPITDGYGKVSTDYLPVTEGQTYTDVLPSLNLTYHLDDANQMRFAVAKVMARPPVEKLLAGKGSWIQDGQYNVWGSTSPLLNPLYANQADLTFEHYYPDSSGIFSVDVFWKHISSFVQSITYNNFDFAKAGISVPTDPTTGKPYLNGQYQTAYNNTQGGTIRGIELDWQKTHFLPGFWSSLGVSTSFAYTQSGVKQISALGGPPQNQGLPGLSRKVASASLFFDNGTVSTRLSGSYRSSFVSDSQIAVGQQTVYFAPEMVYDFQAAYNFTKHLSGLFQVLNLTNQPTRTYFGNPSETGTIQYFGRTAYVGINLSL